MTLSNLASFYYSSYSFTSGNTYQSNAIDATAYAKETYKVSNFSNALQALSTLSTPSGLTKIDSFVQNAYQVSQLDVYDELGGMVSSGNITDLLSGSTGLSGMYRLLGTQLSISTSAVEELMESSSSVSSAIKSYQGYQNYQKNLVANPVLDFTA